MVDSLRLPYDLQGHVALITGANHGIGAATAEALARCGARVLASYLRLAEAARRRPGAASRDKARQAASLPGHPAIRIR